MEVRKWQGKDLMSSEQEESLQELNIQTCFYHKNGNKEKVQQRNKEYTVNHLNELL